MGRRALALAGVGALVLVEIGLRVGVGLGDPPLVTRDDAVEYRLVPSAHYHRFGNRIEINSHGMRSPEHNLESAPKERRVLLIGDSVIYGNHFLDQPQTIGMQMTVRLAALPALSGCQPLVMAAAASSWGPVNQAAFLADTGSLDADLAILVVSGHDLYDTPTDEGALIPYRLRPSFSAIEDALQLAIERLTRRLRDRAPAATVEIRRSETLEAIERIRDQLADDGIPMVLVYHPTVPERQNGLLSEHAFFRDWAATRGLAFANLGEASADGAGMYRDHIHPAASGAAVLAGFLAELAAPLLPDCPP